MNKITENIIAQVTNAEGVVDYATLKEVWKDLTAYRSANKKAAAEAEKANKAADVNEAKARGEAYFLTLAVGTPVSYTKADGTVVEGKVGETKQGAKAAHIVLDEIPAGSKKADRYVAFNQLNVPADFSAEVAA